METASSASLVVFQVGAQDFAIGVAAVERVIRAVEIEPLSEAPRGVRGVINLQGRIVPVFDFWCRPGQAARAVRTTDRLIIARTHWRTVALLVQSVSGVVPAPPAQLTPTAEILPESAALAGVLKLAGGLVLVQDLERFLTADEHTALALALPADP